MEAIHLILHAAEMLFPIQGSCASLVCIKILKLFTFYLLITSQHTLPSLCCVHVFIWSWRSQHPLIVYGQTLTGKGASMIQSRGANFAKRSLQSMSHTIPTTTYNTAIWAGHQNHVLGKISHDILWDVWRPPSNISWTPKHQIPQLSSTRILNAHRGGMPSHHSAKFCIPLNSGLLLIAISGNWC
jgi:hypothetical protein